MSRFKRSGVLFGKFVVRPYTGDLRPRTAAYRTGVQIPHLGPGQRQQHRRMGGQDDLAAEIPGGIRQKIPQLQLAGDGKTVLRLIQQIQGVFGDALHKKVHGAFAVGVHLRIFGQILIDKAGFCVSATAERDGVSLIAVVMGADSRESRNNAARAMLDYGFANYTLYSDSEGPLENIPVLRGVKDSTLAYSSGFSCLLGKGDDKRVEKHYDIPESIYAPIEIGEKIGEIVYTLDGEEIGRADITVAEDISAISVFELFMRIISNIIFVKII